MSKPLPKVIRHLPSIGVILVEHSDGKREAYSLMGKAGLEYANAYKDYLNAIALYSLRYDD
ncbi:hypothetical protein CLI64_08130 [Nostoc sp. CENA543]|uniref:hypothetical protein n=1 Tax=Nostoc sp. CENA543 TaxID=1869241 RepID=UPI000CA20BC5|nr:hypothetical protein [Nostoc sp. CENA543]AUT00356.1 hypothetical protein CLI64_08130 [Nostoc sp. CENA543]